MSRSFYLVAAGAGAMLSTSAMAQNWVNFTNESSSRLIAIPGLGSADPEEKDFAYGDFDQDGDVDLAVARKQPFTTAGRKVNVLFMNEGIAEGHAFNGILVNRTAEYASEADDGGQGFNDLTADRDIIAVDVNMDGWLDLVTAPTYGQGLAKSISHPRIYINQGQVDGEWQGFIYEEARIPNLGGAPNFCGVGAGDVTGDGAPDLYFVDYDNVSPSPFDDRLLINDGKGFFTDESATRATAAMLASSFGTTANIVDMNGDGWADIVKNENGPTKTLYNAGDGEFEAMQSTYNGASYFANVEDLNKDGKYDIIISDDGTDRYLLNNGNGGNGQATFTSMTFPADSGGFGSSSRFADLNNDTHLDVMIADVDVDIPGCDRSLHIYRNLGNYPNPTMASQGSGGIPAGMLTGTHDIAPIDLNGDGWIDLVMGRCSAIQIWMNVPPIGLVFTYPNGLPGFLPSNTPLNFEVEVTAFGGGAPEPGTGVLHYSINNGPFTAVAMSEPQPNVYSAVLPGVECASVIKFYVTAELDNGSTFQDPATGAYTALAAEGSEITIENGFEGAVADWEIVNETLTGGAWEAVDPNSTINFGEIAAPEDDAGAGDDVKAFVTQNGAAGGGASAADVDGGPTYLISPILDLEGIDATISYDRWFYCEDEGVAGADFLVTEISKDGGKAWVTVHQTGGTNNAWQNTSFRVGEFVSPTGEVRIRFSTSDVNNNSVTEAGIDNFTVEELVCDSTGCPADVSPDGSVNTDDLLTVINAWGATGGVADITKDGTVDTDDLLAVINAWGSCP